jgi:hypothetical protein
MNDATLRQMAAAKTTVNNENHMSRPLLGRLHSPVCSTPTEAPCKLRKGFQNPIVLAYSTTKMISPSPQVRIVRFGLLRGALVA